MDDDLCLEKELLLIGFKNGIWKLCTPSVIQTQIIPMDSSQCRLSKHVSPVCEATDQQSGRIFRNNCSKRERHEEGNLDVVVDVELGWARVGPRDGRQIGGGRQIY